MLSGRDTLAVMPTGGGKSLCYQIPALMKGPGEGITLVVCPLVSLMKDQVESLRRRLDDPGAVAALHSKVPARERREIERRALSGALRVLFVAPERLRSLQFCVFLKRAAGGRGVSLLVVDEAHCISEWGHSFRPEYLFLGPVIADLASRRTVGAADASPRVPILALTATADPRVREDIVALLGMEDPEEVVTGFDRPNLSYAVRKTHLPAGGARLPLVLELLKDAEMPAVIYAHTKRHTEEFALGLAEAGIEARPYHAGMAATERDAVQDAFMGGTLPVICATVAFGMGVDKPDIRTVIHAGVPSSVSAYAQEAGRAGRDGEAASCVVFFSEEELEARRELASLGHADASDARLYLEALQAVAGPAAGGFLRPPARQRPGGGAVPPGGRHPREGPGRSARPGARRQDPKALQPVGRRPRAERLPGCRPRPRPGADRLDGPRRSARPRSAARIAARTAGRGPGRPGRRRGAFPPGRGPRGGCEPSLRSGRPLAPRGSGPGRRLARARRGVGRPDQARSSERRGGAPAERRPGRPAPGGTLPPRRHRALRQPHHLPPRAPPLALRRLFRPQGRAVRRLRRVRLTPRTRRPSVAGPKGAGRARRRFRHDPKLASPPGPANVRMPDASVTPGKPGCGVRDA